MLAQTPLPSEHRPQQLVPVDVFGSGPQVIAAAARRADRVTVTVGAKSARVEWAVRTAREARQAAGLDLQTLGIGQTRPPKRPSGSRNAATGVRKANPVKGSPARMTRIDGASIAPIPVPTTRSVGLLERTDNRMTWWVWGLITWGSVASAAVVYLSMRLAMHVEWREATLTELEGRPRPEALSTRVRAALLQFVEIYRRVASGPRP